ncbi:MAG: hypothetical protein L0211_24585, partial [Planctomycetaceae bacterium]|nr:hypothetical protein [Planctomycetaceae bacterium]
FATLAGLIATIGLFLVAIVAAIVYIGGPILIYASHRQSARPNLVPFQPGATPLPADVDQYFHTTSWALAQQGFEIVTGMFLPSQVENVVVALIFLVNRQEKDAAVCVAMHNNAPGMFQTVFHLEFATRYRDGRVVQTNNAANLNAFPIPPECTNSYLPSVIDPVQLYRVHQAVCRRQGGGQKVLKLDEQFGGDAVRYMTDAIIEELDAAAKAGYMRRVESEGVYRPTLMGALKMTYGELWPYKGVRLRWRAHRERQLLAELAGAL